MIKYLEDTLREKTKDTQSEILLAQWNYDKKVIPAALQAVSNLFPHYSLHDESHSITIINNIVRVLGKENINKLSAIDIWLILEASYSHDIGMVVSSEKLIEAIKSQQFIDFFKELLQNKKNGLHEFAIQFQIIDNQIRQKNELLNIELNDAIKFILAEFFRKIHAERSQEIINDPLNELSLLSPRGVIPPRIFKMLGNICSCHTKNFSDVLNLPFCQVGIDLEDAHPRFIACLLRIGDLLDLDNNRFSEVMLRTLSKIPIDTLNHKAKHLSIESFRIDRDIIEITANCKDYDTANITQHWFNYLNSEINNQTINWNNIVPFKELGYLPTIGSLKVELSDYDFIDGKNKPKFSVDTDKALGLLQGAGLYDGAYQCIREILQNAVDSTLIRIWLENKMDKDFSLPYSSDFLGLTNSYPIKINIEDKGEDGLWKNWEIVVEDKGTGISTYDLKFLMNTGSSSKNIERQNIIENMPIWMRPSGTFGIGFQSIFMLTDLVKIETKSFFTEKFQIIELNSPNSKKDGDILIQRKKTSHVIKPGTKIIINHKTKAIPEGYSIKGEHKNANRIARNFDPFSHKSMDIELGKILDEILDFSEKSYFPTILTVDSNELETSPSVKKFMYFDIVNNIELNIFHGEKTAHWRTSTYYKNQKAENNIVLHFLGLEINIHKEKASEVLTLNRNKIKPEFQHSFMKQLFFSSFKIITENFDEIFNTEESKQIGSMFLNYYSNDELKEFDLNKFNQWQDLMINIGDKEINILNLLTTIKTLKVIYDFSINRSFGDEFILTGDELTLNLHAGSPTFDYTKFFLFKAREYFTSIIKKNTAQNIKEVYFAKGQQKSPILKDDILDIIKNLRGGYPSSARAIIPCIEDFFELRIRDDSHESYVYHYVIDDNIYLPFPKMLSPFVREDTGNRQYSLKIALNQTVIDWVFKNRYDSSITKETIIDSYNSFCGMFKLEEINSDQLLNNIY